MNGNGKTIVIKIGSRTLSAPDGGVDEKFLEQFVSDISWLHEQGCRVALVSSGAIRIGAPLLGLDRNKLDIHAKQASASVGQGVLISKYIRLFEAKGIVAAQALFTPDIVNMRKMYLNARNTLRALLSLRAVPVINENDTVGYDEIKFGDNDTLSAITAMMVEADLLVLLSDVDGLYTGVPGNPGVEMIKEVTEITPQIREMAGGPGSDGGFGGMITKINAAQAAMDSGTKMIIANGREENVLQKIYAGESVGTSFIPRETTLSGRKRWIAHGMQINGGITVNHGAAQAIKNDGKSLLAIGITSISGSFEEGDCVGLYEENGALIARGLTNYSSAEVDKIKGKRSSDIESILGYMLTEEVVHRDDLARI